MYNANEECVNFIDGGIEINGFSLQGQVVHGQCWLGFWPSEAASTRALPKGQNGWGWHHVHCLPRTWRPYPKN